MSTQTPPKKDVVYIDIEDDITAVIEKVKTSKASVVALVPPKRVGVLQSVVNLKLLKRAAGSAKKHIVLITNDKALIGLAAGVSVPVAKNLQSKPELPQMTAAKIDDDEVINGAELPVGELAKTSDTPIESVLDDLPAEPTPASKIPFAAKAAGRAPKKGSAVPDFDKFRKKLFIFGGAGVLLIIFLVWAIFFAPHATVSITAKTNIVNISKTLQLRPGATLDAAQAIAPAIVKETKKTNTVDFTATGKKDVGETATGTVKFSTNNISNLGTIIPAGTKLTASNGLVYATTASITMTIQNSSGATTGVNAAERGSKYNGASGNVSGAPSGISASLVGSTAGGTDKTITVVSQSDIDKAKEQLQAQNSDQIKTDLQKQFDKSAMIVQESFAVEPAAPASSPGLDQEASTAKLTAETTYRLVGLARSDLQKIYDTYTKTQITGEKAQKIYESGDKVTAFSQFSKVEGGFSVQAQATAQVGPNIDDAQLAKQLVGKRDGEIRQQIEGIQGVEDVTVKFSPFWVTRAPGSADKIDIKFVVKHDER